MQMGSHGEAGSVNVHAGDLVFAEDGLSQLIHDHFVFEVEYPEGGGGKDARLPMTIMLNVELPRYVHREVWKAVGAAHDKKREELGQLTRLRWLPWRKSKASE